LGFQSFHLCRYTAGVAAATGAQWAANVAVTGTFLQLLVGLRILV
jgi:hypothetical protein